MKLSRNEVFDLLNKEVSDELLLAINEERAQLFREVVKHRNIAAHIQEQVQTYNRLLDQNEKRLTKLLTNGEGW
jgi:succinate dehydrogenase flavin-adding protein (antitoxin of CptAB toxin-antitoxin module)